jgi:hypothetical protein
MEKKVRYGKIELLYGSTILVLFVYIIIRAYHLGFTHDESLTYTIITGRTKWLFDANNHWVNTILSGLFSVLFGFSELSLRLPNVLSFIVYSFFCYCLVLKKSKYRLSALLALSFLLLNPFLIDFFSLARGYGLATAFFCGSLWFFSDFLERHHIKNLTNGIIFSLLTVYSNYSYLYPTIALQLSFFIFFFASKADRQLQVKVLKWTAIEIIFLIPGIINIIILRLGGALYYGTTMGFIEGTLPSILSSIFQVKVFNNQELMFTFLILILLFSGIFFIKRNREFFFILLVMFVSIFLPVIFNMTIGILYPKQRGALYLIVLLGVYLHRMTETILDTGKKYYSGLIFSIIMLLISFICFNFFKTTNIKYAYYVQFDAETGSMLETLNKIIDKNKTYNLGIDWQFEATINYYREVKKYDWLNPVTREGIEEKEYNYYYIFEDDKKTTNINLCGEVKKFDFTKTVLIKGCSENGF